MGLSIGSINRRQLSHSRPVLIGLNRIYTTVRQCMSFYRRDNDQHIYIYARRLKKALTV